MDKETRMGQVLVGIRAAIYMAGFILFWGWVALNVQRFDAEFDTVLPTVVRPAGALFMVLGGAVVSWCGLVFVVRGQGTPAPFDPPQQFVATGPYRYVRNPIYIGGLCLISGLGLYQRSISILLFAIFYAVLVHAFVVLVEEPGLVRRFGGSYVHYKQSVNRWLPRRG